MCYGTFYKHDGQEITDYKLGDINLEKKAEDNSRHRSISFKAIFGREGRLESIIIYAAAILSAFIISALLILAYGADPITAFSGFFLTLGSLHGITEVFVRATPILLTGLAVTVAFRCKVFNLGIEGQFWIGAIATTGLGLVLSLPFIIFIPLLLLASFLAAGAYASVAGVLKAKYGINEIVLTLMMNFIALQLGTYMFETAWRDPTASHSQTPLISPLAWLPRLVPATRLNAGLLIALAFIPLMYIFLWKTTWGYELRATGGSFKAATFGGINAKRSVMLAMFISGGLAGVAGMLEVTGLFHLLIEGISAGYGFFGVAAGLLGRLNPIGVTLSALFLSIISVGVDTMQRTAQVPIYLVSIIQALLLLFLVSVEHLVQRRRK